ncbi:MAG: glycosyltransferase [Desulfurococcaceae archaeon]
MVSQPVLIRRMLGRRGTFLLRRIASNIAYYTGHYEYANFTSRQNGISALMCTYNEEDWVEPAVLSIKNLVDEYVIVDSSTDRTPEIINDVKNEHGLNIKLLRVPPGDIVRARTAALENSSFKWLLFFDADMVLHERAVKAVKELTESLDPRRHYIVYWKYLLLCGDLNHLCGEEPYHVERWLITYSSRLRYRYLDYGRGVAMDYLYAPLRLYKPILLDEVLGVHLTRVRTPEKLAMKHIRLEHRKLLVEHTMRGLTAEEAVSRIARETYGTDDLRELGEKLIRDMTFMLPRYDESRYGPLPQVLLNYVKNNKPLNINSTG